MLDEGPRILDPPPSERPGAVQNGMGTMITLDTTIVRSDAVLSASVNGETVLMIGETGQYHAMAATSNDILNRLAEPVCVRDLCAALVLSYQAPAGLVESDTLEFLNHLEEQKIIDVL